MTDSLVPLLVAAGGPIVGRVAFGLAVQHSDNLYRQADTTVAARTLTVAVLGRIGDDDPYEAVAHADPSTRLRHPGRARRRPRTALPRRPAPTT